MINRPLYVRKYHSGRLKEFNYVIHDTFEESKAYHEIVGLSDNQMLRTIREVSRRTLKRDHLEKLILCRNFYQKQLSRNQLSEKKAAVFSEELKRLQAKINRTLFQENYIIVVMDTEKQYEYLYQNGFIVNDQKYKRLSCSAGQARISTVVFCKEALIPEVTRRLNNGRNLDKPLSPSKFNAYFGLAGSATQIVSEPRFIVVKDYENTACFMANYVIENGWKADDTIIQKEIKDTIMNRTDGMGLISYRQAEKWAKELNLDYVPSQFCIRQNFMKGMLCVFPIHEFALEYGRLDEMGRCMVDTIYCDENGKPVKKNLFDYDVIISESQFKLWDSFESMEQYIENCRRNHLYWGVALTSPKEAKRMLKLNYQFIQTLNLTEQDVKKLAEQFVEWILGVSYENRYYMLLFLLGVNNNEEKIKNFLSSSDQYWIKALLLSDDVKHDKYIRKKIRELIRHKIDAGCKGDIYVDGNFQVIVSDPFGYMQHVCGLEVTGLLKPGMSYSHYWNEKGVTQVDAMRSPLTYLSEHVILNLQKDDETEKWYRYCKLGIILNYHGHETFHFAGSDFDMDILATTSNPVMINGVYKDELPVVYKVPKPDKILFTEDDLYRADTFSFGSIIGSITNKSSNAYALLPVIKKTYGEKSQEYRLLKSRLQQCCKAQSAQIDKAKIGRAVKGIPQVWTKQNKIKKNKKGKAVDRKKRRKELYNTVLLNTYPYFFRYIYKETDRSYKKYLDEYNILCKQKFRIGISELEALQSRTDEQEAFIRQFYHYCPVIISNSPMNLLCRYIEDISFQISQKTKTDSSFRFDCYKNHEVEYLGCYTDVVSELKKFMKELKNSIVITCFDEENTEEYSEDKINALSVKSEDLYERLSQINKNPYVILNCLIDYFYIEKPASNKELLWKSYGKFICKNIMTHATNACVDCPNHSDNTSILFPMPTEDTHYDMEYLGYHYKLQEVQIEL